VPKALVGEGPESSHPRALGPNLAGRVDSARPSLPISGRDCQRVIPINRWPVKTLPTQKCRPHQVLSFVEWCGHQQEGVLVPEGDGWYSEIPVLGWRRELTPTPSPQARRQARTGAQGFLAGRQVIHNCG
jgi:hypothetical protein